MEITFQTKEESNREQRLAFLRLSKSERFAYFLQLMEVSSKFLTKKTVNNNAFKIEI